MVVVMRERATDDQIQSVIAKLMELGFDVHRSTGALHRDGACLDLLLALGRARTGHDDHLVAAYPNIVEDDDRVVGLERAAGQLVRLSDAVHLLDAVEDFEQRRVELARAADGAKDSPERARGAVHVEAHLRQLRDDRLNLGV